MKPLTFLLGCLLLAAVFNFALDLYQQAHYRTLAPTFAQIGPFGPADQSFDEQTERIDDPAELRRIARTQHAKRQDVYLLLAALLDKVNRTDAIATLRSGTLLVRALGEVGFALRARPAASENKPADFGPPP